MSGGTGLEQRRAANHSLDYHPKRKMAGFDEWTFPFKTRFGFFTIEMHSHISYYTVDPDSKTRPHYVIEQLGGKLTRRRNSPTRRTLRIGCYTVLVLLICFLMTSSVYLFVPFRTNILLLGIDRSPDGTAVGRSDTNILVTVLPLKPYVGMLSFPRDLWVNIPDFGQNRINAAHFFAESDQPGSGSIVALETIHQNFGIDVNYFVRIRFDGLINIVDALGGLDIELEEQMAGYPPGDYHLDGEKALAFVRDRQGTDDFFRMQQGQFFLKEAWEQLVQPRGLIRFPALMAAVTTTVDTNLPLWLWPRLGLAFLRAGSRGIDSRVISREMVTPFTISEGAQVLMPDWDKITPVLLVMFGQ